MNLKKKNSKFGKAYNEAYKNTLLFQKSVNNNEFSCKGNFKYLDLMNDLYESDYINNDETYSYIFSQAISSFIIQHIGLFIHFKLFTFKSKIVNLKYQLKKKIFSFYKKNEIRKSIMENRKSIYIFKYINAHDSDNIRRSSGDLEDYNMDFDFFLKKKLSYRIFSQRTFHKNPYINSLMGFKKTSLDLHSFDYIKYPDPECKENYEDIRIPRLRFKPGYQRL